MCDVVRFKESGEGHGEGGDDCGDVRGGVRCCDV
jgi:hypothetical protein